MDPSYQEFLASLNTEQIFVSSRFQTPISDPGFDCITPGVGMVGNFYEYYVPLFNRSEDFTIKKIRIEQDEPTTSSTLIGHGQVQENEESEKEADEKNVKRLNPIEYNELKNKKIDLGVLESYEHPSVSIQKLKIVKDTKPIQKDFSVKKEAKDTSGKLPKKSSKLLENHKFKFKS